MQALSWNSSQINDNESFAGWNGSEFENTSFVETRCELWAAPQDVLYQVGNCFIVLSFLLPPKFNLHMLFLRLVIAIGSVHLALFGALKVCNLDVCVWNTLFAVINAAWAIKILYGLRPIKLDHDVNEFYKLLEPFGISKHEFQCFCKGVGRIHELPAGTRYAIENDTAVGNHVSILLNGLMRVSCDGIPMHIIEATEFVDSPEYERYQHLYRTKQAIAANTKQNASDRKAGSRERERRPSEPDFIPYQVSITVMSDSKILLLNTRRMRAFMREHLQFGAVMHNLIGRDIAQKMQRMQHYLINSRRSGPSGNLTGALDISTSNLVRAKDAINFSVTNLDEKNALLRRVNAVASSVRSIQQDGFVLRSAGPRGSQTALTRTVNQLGQRLVGRRHYSGGNRGSVESDDDDAETEMRNHARPLIPSFQPSINSVNSGS